MGGKVLEVMTKLGICVGENDKDYKKNIEELENIDREKRRILKVQSKLFP